MAPGSVSNSRKRPFFPDGIDGYPNGPLSKPYAQWSPFGTGLQLDLDYERIAQHVLFGLGAGPDVGPSCAGPPGPAAGFNTTVPAMLGDGLQIFAGGVPIYRGSKLVGAVGVSGDGIDQDDMVAFLGLYNAGQALGTIGNALHRHAHRPARASPGPEGPLRGMPAGAVPEQWRAVLCDGK